MGRPARQAPLRVLVADDHEDSRLLIQTFLSLLGFLVRGVADGREALREAPLFHPDVVFLDIWMPGLNGVETCQRLREGPAPSPCRSAASLRTGSTSKLQSAASMGCCRSRWIWIDWRRSFAAAASQARFTDAAPLHSRHLRDTLSTSTRLFRPLGNCPE